MKTAALPLALSVVALCGAVVALTQAHTKSAEPPARLDRVAKLERQVAELSRQIKTLRAGPEDSVGAPDPDCDLDAVSPVGDPVDEIARPPSREEEKDDQLAALVNNAVDRKTKQVLDEMRIKANTKPAIGVFAKMLELSDEQRVATERIVAEGQREVHEILRTPTAHGGNFMNELVEIVAKGMAQPGRDHGFRQWFARVVAEKIPGTDEAYGARIDAVKKRMHGDFKRTWTKEQYKEFQEWGVDPTEVQQVPDSPNAELWAQIVERARELGAKVPQNR